MSKSFHLHVQHSMTSPNTAAIFKGSALNNKAMDASRAGNYALAERLHLEALATKEAAFGSNALTTALTRNALGELYLRMDRLDDAEVNLKKAMEYRSKNEPEIDAAVTRENLGQVLAAKGNMTEARNMRLSGNLDAMVCSSLKCPGEAFKLTELNQCGKCKAAFYCSQSCQSQDWKARHKKCCKPASV